MIYLFIALGAYLLNAVSFLIDKHLLAAPIPKPFAYTFWTALLSASAVFLIPFGVHWPGSKEAIIGFVSGAAFFAGLFFLYCSVRHGDITVSAANAGAFTALFSAVFAVGLLGENLLSLNVVALGLLISGIFFLAQVDKRILRHSVFAGLSFGLSFVLLKFGFNEIGFVNGVFWTRMGFVATALISLAWPIASKEIRTSFHQAPSGSRILFVVNKALVGTGFLLLYWAIKIGDVTFVNALMGFQFIFVMFLTTLLRKRMPGVSEHLAHHRGKLVGVALILLGFLATILL